jgi:hypothetical protein
VSRWVVFVPPVYRPGVAPEPVEVYVVDAPSLARAVLEVARKLPPSQGDRARMGLAVDFETVYQKVVLPS